MSQSQNVTICIPTKDRLDFLKRSLAYYAKIGFQGSIFVADGSNPDILRENKKNSGAFEKALRVRHFDCSGKSILSSVDHVNRFLETPYAAVCSDDDFLCLRGIERSVDLMEQHAEYSGCHGLGAIMGIDSQTPYGEIRSILPYPQAVLDASTGSLRLKQYFEQGPSALVYSVHRSAQWKEMWKDYPHSKSCFIFDELVPSGYSAIRGKIAQIDTLYLVRQMHERIYRQTPFYDWITHPLWQPNYEYFRNLAIRELMAADPISQEEAGIRFKEIFQDFLAKTFRNYTAKQEKAVTRSASLKEKIKKMAPYAAEISFAVKRSFLLKSKEDIGLSVLKADSRHYNDFKAIQDIVGQNE